MRKALLVLGGLMVLVGLFLMSAVFTAREVRDAETNKFIYGVITAIVGLVIAIVAKVFISQRK